VLAGYDPDEMLIDDWCDVAWQYLLGTAPMMAAPSEYRDALWSVLHDGKPPKQKPKTPEPVDRDGRRRSRRALPRARTGMTAADKSALAAFTKRIDQVKAERAS
jgi:hypothetical protein